MSYAWPRRPVLEPVATAIRLGDADARKYADAWAAAVAKPDAAAALPRISAAWQACMANASSAPKRQDKEWSFAVLFAKSTKLNDVFQAKFQAMCSACGGAFHRSDVKAEPRALQKVFRSYGGDFRKLCDLVRTTLVFRTLGALADCLPLKSQFLEFNTK